MKEIVNKLFLEEKTDNFKKEISDSLFNKYGLFPQNHITFLLEEELEFVDKNNRIEEVIILYDFIKWLKKEEIPYWLRGAAGSSLLFYILGITRGNPLPAHSFCPKCKSMDWLDHDYYSGFDVKEDLRCKKDGYLLLTDGHNIPWESFWSYEGNEIVFTIDLPIDSYQKIKGFWESYQAEILKEDILVIRKEFKGLRFLNIDCIFTIEKVNQDFYKTNLDIVEAIKNFDLGDLPKPHNFSDLLHGLGLKFSTGAWTDKTKFMIENLGMNLSDMVAFREDVFFFISGKFAYMEDAWLETRNFNKGKKSWRDIGEINLAVDKWKLAIIEDILYLFPKAHCMEYLIFSIKNKYGGIKDV
ncbi:MAG: hypothetical protein GX300_04680 [Tissierellia bacterium]|nr:hypothetical protein [Tissierellia bacterium]